MKNNSFRNGGFTRGYSGKVNIIDPDSKACLIFMGVAIALLLISVFLPFCSTDDRSMSLFAVLTSYGKGLQHYGDGPVCSILNGLLHQSVGIEVCLILIYLGMLIYKLIKGWIDPSSFRIATSVCLILCLSAFFVLLSLKALSADGFHVTIDEGRLFDYDYSWGTHLTCTGPFDGYYFADGLYSAADFLRQFRLSFGAVCVMFSVYLFVAACSLCLIQVVIRKKSNLVRIPVPTMPYFGVPCGMKRCM